MRRDISPTCQIRAELRMKSGHSFWAKYRETSHTSDLHGLFNDYWGSGDHQFTVLGQSLSRMSLGMSDSSADTIVIGKYTGSLELHFSANATVRTSAISHRRRLRMSA